MDNKLKVSVIMPIYNAAEFLREGLDSLLKQTLHEIEIICVNDGSKDQSLEILREYEKKDSRIKIIDQKNQGAGAARNNGMHVAQGEYLAFLLSFQTPLHCLHTVSGKYAQNADLPSRCKRSLPEIRF